MVRKLTVVFVAGLLVLATGLMLGVGLAQEDPEVEFSDQNTTGEVIYIDEVHMEEGGFVAVTAEDIDNVEQVDEGIVGISEYLESGTHEDVQITLAYPLEDVPAVEEPAEEPPVDGEVEVEVDDEAEVEDDEVEVEDDEAEIEDDEAEIEDDEAEVEDDEAEVEDDEAEVEDDEAEVEDDEAEVEDDEAEVEDDEAEVEDDEAEPVQADENDDVEENDEVAENDEEVDEEDPVVSLTAHVFDDTNENEVFDYIVSEGEVDGLAMTEDEMQVNATANVTVTHDYVAELVMNETTLELDEDDMENHSVMVDEAMLSHGGFVAITAEGTVVGTSGFLAPGTHEDVEIHLVGNLTEMADNETVELSAQAHRDTNHNMVLDFFISEEEQDFAYPGPPHLVEPATEIDDDEVEVEDDEMEDDEVGVEDDGVEDEVMEDDEVEMEDDEIEDDEVGVEDDGVEDDEVAVEDDGLEDDEVDDGDDAVEDDEDDENDDGLISLVAR